MCARRRCGPEQDDADCEAQKHRGEPKYSFKGHGSTDDAGRPTALRSAASLRTCLEPLEQFMLLRLYFLPSASEMALASKATIASAWTPDLADRPETSSMFHVLSVEMSRWDVCCLFKASALPAMFVNS